MSENPKNQLLIILTNKLMNNGANPKSKISGFSTDLTEINQIWSRLTGSDKSLTEGGDLNRSRVDLQHPLWGISPSLSPPHLWALLEALGIDLSVKRLMCQLNLPLD